MKKQSLIIIYLMLIFLLGCNRITGESELQKPDKSPESINEVSSGIDDIGMSLDEIERLYMNVPAMEKEDELSETAETESSEGQEGQEDSEGNNQEENSDEENSNQGDNSGGGNGGSGSSGNESSQKKEEPKSDIQIRDEEILKIWKEIESNVEEIHGHWDEYMVESQKKPVSKDQLNSFEEALNKLTLSIGKKDIMASYGEMAQAYLNLSPIFDLYLDDIMGEISSIKHGVFMSYATGMDSIEIGESYNRIRHKLDDETKNDLINKLENSVSSFKLGLLENTRRLNMIKKNIVLENISELGD